MVPRGVYWAKEELPFIFLNNLLLKQSLPFKREGMAQFSGRHGGSHKKCRVCISV